jgi:hypothetical protein
MSNLLFGVSPRDRAMLGLVGALLGCVVLSRV